jgi:hypothetical protein
MSALLFSGNPFDQAARAAADQANDAAAARLAALLENARDRLDHACAEARGQKTIRGTCHLIHALHDARHDLDRAIATINRERRLIGLPHE